MALRVRAGIQFLFQSQNNDAYLETEEFKKEVKKAANTLLGEIEWRKRQLEKKMEEEEGVRGVHLTRV